MQRYVIPSDKDGYTDTFVEEQQAQTFVSEQHRWEDSKIDHAVMKFGSKDAQKKYQVCCNTNRDKLLNI